MIVEIGPQPFVSRALPKESLFYSTQWPNVELDPTRVIGSLRELWGVLGRADVELIVVFPTFFGPLSLRRLNRAIFSRRMMRENILTTNDLIYPVFVIEGTDAPSNIDALDMMKNAPHPASVHFEAVPGASHFSVLAPTNERIAQAILRDQSAAGAFEWR